MDEKIFDIAFEFDNVAYKGWVNPSDELNDTGVPVSFHVVLNDTSFGYLAFKDCRWSINEQRSAGMVKLVGKQIEKHFQL